MYIFEAVRGPHRAAVPFAVDDAGHHRVLVVLPLMTWQGRNLVDDDGDGLPNDLPGGHAVKLARVLARPLPATFAEREAPTLIHLDGARHRYDITTDLALALRRGPRLEDHAGVLLAGDAVWMPPALQRRLRRFVTRGGTLATVGVGSLQREARLTPRLRLINPTPRASTDVWGSRITPPAPGSFDLTGLDDELGLFTGTDGSFGGFTSAEVTTAAGPREGRLLGRHGGRPQGDRRAARRARDRHPLRAARASRAPARRPRATGAHGEDMGPALPLIACSALAAAALVVRSDRARAWLLLGALLGAASILAVHVSDADQLDAAGEHRALLGAGIVAGVVLLAALAVLFARVPAALPLAAVATIPFRIPLSIGGSTASLLLPLYLVIAAGALAWALPRIRPSAASAAAAVDWETAPEDQPPGDTATWRPGGLEWSLAAVLVLYAAGSAWSSDTDRALENIVFFYVPFAVLFALLARLAWTPRIASAALGVLASLAAALAVIGYVEYATRHLLLNPKVIASNQVEDYFRVNSLFFDPNIYGRFLAIVLVLIVAWSLWRTRTRDVALAGLVCAVLFGGLVLTLSQSSFAALLAGLAVLGGLRWNPRRAALAALLALALAGGAFLAATDLSSSSSANDATSGRYELIKGGAGLAGDAPIAGQGSGSFPREYRRAEHVSAERATSASHTIPITVLAEQGIVGLAAYLALLWFALRRLLPGARVGAARAGVAAAFVALVVHTLLYAAFLEDPLTWALLGVGTALAAMPPPAPVAPAQPSPPEPEAA